MSDTVVLWAVVSRWRSGGSWTVVMENQQPLVFSHKAMAERRVTALDEADGDVFLYMPLPMQGHPLLMEAAAVGRPHEGHS